MIITLLALGVLLFSGLLSLLAGHDGRRANFIGAAGTIFGCSLGLYPALAVLAGGASQQWSMPWNIPLGRLSLELDPLSALFLIPIYVLCAAAALYGGEYLMAYTEKKNPGASWFFFNVLAAGMALVVLAGNGVLFLMAWEVMALSSFFLVTFESESENVSQAGWIYLVATHLGSAFLLVFFVLLGSRAGSMDFHAFSTAPISAGSMANVVFLLAVVGFGAKAGFMPFHVWLPEAHPAAPSHVSAVMSGVMIKTGIYGLMRTLTFLDTPPLWWGWLLLGVGVVSGVLGVLFALAQHDIKRLLAYHSVENIGIIALGMGLGVLGLGMHLPSLAVLGFGGSLLHVVNHALFKGLLFLGAGSVVHAASTKDMDHLGGLIKRMPWTAAVFAVGAVAICGLPPLNGFVSEFLIYVGAWSTVGKASASIGGVVILAALALIGGLAAACFTKAFGIVFLGEPRSDHAAQCREAGWPMRLGMGILASLCMGIGAFAPLAVRMMSRAIAVLVPFRLDVVQRELSIASVPLLSVVLVSGIFLLLLVLLILLRRRILASRPVEESCTWDCGYLKPSSRMQYSSSSYAQPITDLFSSFLRTRRIFEEPTGFFPAYASLRTETPDIFLKGVYRPVFLAVEWVVMKLRWLQEGRIQLYILYIAVTLLSLLIWNLR